MTLTAATSAGAERSGWLSTDASGRAGMPSALQRRSPAAIREKVARAAHELLGSLVTNAPPRDREVEAAKARAKAAGRFGTSQA